MSVALYGVAARREKFVVDLIDQREPALRDYVAVFRRYWLLMGALVVAAVGASIAYVVLTPPMYEARSAVLLRTQSNQQLFPSVGVSQAGSFVLNPVAELEYASSGSFAVIVGPEVGSASVEPRYDDIDTNAFDRSNELEFVARSEDRTAAIDAANRYAETYVVARQTLATEEVQATIAVTEARIDELEAEKSEILEPLEPLNEALTTEDDPDVISRLTTQRLALQQTLDDELLPVRSELSTITSDLSNLRIRATALEREGVLAQVSSEAIAAEQVAPQAAQSIGFAGIFALLAAAALALVLDAMQTVVRNQADVDRVSGGVPVLAEIPPLRTLPAEDRDPGALPSAVGSPYVEALETLVTALGLISLGDGATRLLITSPQSSEGKTTLSAHLAGRLAATGVRTVVVDADMRRPRLHAALGLSNSAVGLANVLTGHAELDDAVQPITHRPGLSAVTSGPTPDAPAALVRSPELGSALAKLGDSYEFVVVDSPPVIPVSDAQAIAAVAIDEVILVVRAGQSTRDDVAEAIARLDRAGQCPVGIVLTDVNDLASDRYGYSETATE